MQHQIQLRGNGSIAKRDMCWLLAIGLSLWYFIVIMSVNTPYGVRYLVLALTGCTPRYRRQLERGGGGYTELFNI